VVADDRNPEVAAVAYLEEHRVDPKEMRTHNFRHSAISKWLDAGGDNYVAAQLVGTSDKMLEKRYGHPNIELLHEKHMAFAASNPVPPPWTVTSQQPAMAGD
jgi:integrase